MRGPPHAQGALLMGKKPLVPIQQEPQSALDPVWMFWRRCKFYTPPTIWISGYPACSLVTLLTMIPWFPINTKLFCLKWPSSSWKLCFIQLLLQRAAHSRYTVATVEYRALFSIYDRQQCLVTCMEICKQWDCQKAMEWNILDINSWCKFLKKIINCISNFWLHDSNSTITEKI